MAGNYREVEEAEARRRWKIMAGIGVGLFLLIIAVVVVLATVNKKEVNTKTGVSAITTLENTDIGEIEEAIDALEEAERVQDEEYANRTPQEKMAGSLIMGDSITQGFTEYSVVDQSVVLAERGIHLTELDDVITKAVSLNPKNIFLCYGMNDIEELNADIDTFLKRYNAVVDTLQERLPKTKIYINSVLSVNEKALSKIPGYEYLEDYNSGLFQLCKDQGITFIDNTSIEKEEDIEEDGIHRKATHYGSWANHMAEVAGL